MVTSAPWLSVIVPTFNGSGYLKLALESVAAQAADDVEVVIVDDGSTDDTCEVAQSFGSRLSITWHALDHGGNWVRATNVGLQLARGRFASFLHQDDLWLPNRVSTLRALSSSLGDSAFVLSASAFIDRRGNRIGSWNCPLLPGKHPSADVVRSLIVQNFVAIPAPLFPLSMARELGGLDEHLWYTADWDFWLRCAAAATTVHYHPGALAAFRVHAASQTLARSSAALEMKAQQETVVRRYLPLIEPRWRSSVGRLSAASIAVNAALARTAASDFRGWPEAAVKVFALGPIGLVRYLRQARAIERVGARLRADLKDRRPA